MLRNFLRKAFELSAGKCVYAISYEGEVVLAEGTDSMSGFDDDKPNVLCSRLVFSDIHGGRIHMRVPADATKDECAQYERQLNFTTYSIQEVIDMERARRSIAEEALAKYRELALLHRSVPAINMSLRLRDVVGALINECRRKLPVNGHGFLSEPGSSHYRLAVQFGLPSASGAECGGQ